MIKYHLIKKLVFFITYIVFSLIDNFLWILIKILPKKRLLSLIKKRYFKNFKLEIQAKRITKIKILFLRVINLRCKSEPLASSCLSRSIAARIFLDLINLENVIFRYF